MAESPGRSGEHVSGWLDEATALESELVRLRRAVHRNPELGFEEVRTSALVRSTLERLAPELVCRTVAKTGLLASLPADGPVVLLRACIDALPIEDQKDVEYASAVPGACHACGHDGQIAVLAGALTLLARRSPGVSVHGLFQPAEEIDAGARTAIEEGLLDEIEPDLVLGFHGTPGLGAGQVGVKAGPIMASITTIGCEVVGREGHGAEPHLTADAVTAAASLVLDWQVALGRRTDPRQPVVLSVGKLAAGVTANVIPGRAEILGTLRSLDPAIESELDRIVRDVARGVEARTGTCVALSTDLVVPAVVNDPAAADVVAGAARSVLGEGAVVDATPSLGGDDFSWFLQQETGCYFFIGERQKGRETYGWHDPTYDLDENALVVGSAVLGAAAARAR